MKNQIKKRKIKTLLQEYIIYDDEEEEKDEDEYSLKRRFLINIKNKLIYDLISKTNKGYSRNKSNEYNNYDYKEEIVYSTEQFCKKCGTVINIIPDDSLTINKHLKEDKKDIL